VYGICFGTILVVIGAFAAFPIVIVGAAQIAFGVLATLFHCKALHATKARYCALFAIHGIALIWGIAVAVNVGFEDGVGAIAVGTFFVPLPLASICMLCVPSARRFDRSGRIPGDN
jgi:apolipoprotein N-acyltransferase